MLCDLQIFSGSVYPLSAASRTISFFHFPIVFGIIIYLSIVRWTIFFEPAPGARPRRKLHTSHGDAQCTSQGPVTSTSP